MQQNQQVYSKFVERLGQTNYRQLFEITRQEGLLKIFLEQDSIQKNMMQDHLKTRFDIYNPDNLGVTIQSRLARNNLTPKQVEFNKVFKKNSGFTDGFKTFSISQSNTRRISDSSFLEQDTSYQHYPSFKKQETHPQKILIPAYVEAMKTIQISKQYTDTVKVPIQSKRQSKVLASLRISRKFQQNSLSHRIEFNETQTRLIKQLLMNMTGQQYKTYFFITLEQLKRYLIKRYPVGMVDKLCEFLEFPTKMDLTQYVNIIQQINMWNMKDLYFLAFYMMDFNSDGVICPQDIFKLYKLIDNAAAQKDFIILAKVMSQKVKQEVKSIIISLNRAYEKPIYPELYYVTQLSCTVYIRMSRKMKVKAIRTQGKKDTIYHQGFLGLSHKPEQRIKNQEDEKLMKDPCSKKFNYYGEFQPTALGEVFENLELCSLNLKTFQAIFENHLPNFLHDILYFLTLYRFDGVSYQYDVEKVLEISLK